MAWWADWILKALKPAEVLKSLWSGPVRSSDLEPSPESGLPQNVTAASEELAVTAHSVENAPAEIAATSDVNYTDGYGGQDKVLLEIPAICEDDESRRKLIRTLFNDFWTGALDKPLSFAERLDVAEEYINQRLAQDGAGWRLDASTRKQLGLPISMKSPDTTEEKDSRPTPARRARVRRQRPNRSGLR